MKQKTEIILLKKKKKEKQANIKLSLACLAIITILSQTNDQIEEHKTSFRNSSTSTVVYVVDVNREN